MTQIGEPKYSGLDCPHKDKHIGNIYGKLQIVAFSHATSKTRYYRCRCVECGFERVSTFYSIEHNHHICISYPHIGEQIGIFDIIDAHPKEKDKDIIYIAKCRECGCIKESTYNHLKRDCKDQCTHITKFNKMKVAMNYWSNKRIRDIFYGMLTRCYDEELTGERWKNYGGKGIQVCDEWRNNPKSFEDWALQNGYADNLTIDRIDSNKDYCPDNCRWITGAENSSRAGSYYITVNNMTMNVVQWEQYLNLSLHSIGNYKNKYGVEDTIRHIQSLLEYGYDEEAERKLNVNLGKTNKTLQEWSEYLNCNMNDISQYYRTHTYKETVSMIASKVRQKNKQL